MAQQLVAQREEAQTAPAPAMRLYIVPLSRGGWMKRIHLAGPDSQQAKDGLHAAMAQINARPADEPWLTFLTGAIATLRAAGFIHTAH